jgi:WD40 repeat protein
MVSASTVAPSFAEMEEKCVTQRQRAAAGSNLRSQSISGLCRILTVQQKRCLRAHGFKALGVSWHADSRHLASIDQSGAAILWDTVDATVCQYILRPLGTSVAIAPDPSFEKVTMAIGGMDNGISICDMSPSSDKGEESTILPVLHDGLVSAVRFVDGRTLLSGGGDGDLRLWDVTRGGVSTQLLRGHTGDVKQVAIDDAKSCSRIASCSLDQTVRLWDPRSGGETHRFSCPDESCPVSVCFFSAGDAVAAGGSDGTVRIFDARSYGVITEIPPTTGNASSINGIQCSLSGRAIYTCHDDASVRVWDPLGA